LFEQLVSPKVTAIV